MADDYSNFKDIDPNMAFRPADGDGIAWHLPFEAPMQLNGFAWFNQYHLYHRLPEEKPEEVTQYPGGKKITVAAKDCGAYQLSPHTAGGQIRFRTNSSQFQIKGTMLNCGGMDHMAFTGSAGFDLYLNCNGTWKCFGVTRTDHYKQDFSATIVSGVTREVRDVIINFPLYNGVTSLAIGLDADAVLEAPTPFVDERPVVWYGTSIQQGGCASRPGMCSSNILSRMLNREVINLAFSGSGRGEPEIAKMLADIPNPSLYIIDYTWNTDPEALKITLPMLLDIIRAAHPDTPLLLVTPTPGLPSMDEIPGTRAEDMAAVMLDEAKRRIDAGDKNVYTFDAFHDALGDDFWEGTVDLVHLTDLGFYRLSQAMYPVLKTILKQ